MQLRADQIVRGKDRGGGGGKDDRTGRMRDSLTVALGIFSLPYHMCNEPGSSQGEMYFAVYTTGLVDAEKYLVSWWENNERKRRSNSRIAVESTP